MNPVEAYVVDRDLQIQRNSNDKRLQHAVEQFTPHLVRTNYVKSFTWMGVPIIQYPTDMMAIQELIYDIKPDLIIETGIAFGGSLLFYASILETLQHGRVLGIDIDPREHNVDRIENSSMGHRISHIKGSSVESRTVTKVYDFMYRYKCNSVMVILDSHHTHEHVLQELGLYSPPVSVGSYLIVMDSAIEFFGHLDKNQDRPWGKGNNPWTATQEFLENNDNFKIDKEVEQRALITSAIDGWLRRV